MIGAIPALYRSPVKGPIPYRSRPEVPEGTPVPPMPPSDPELKHTGDPATVCAMIGATEPTLVHLPATPSILMARDPLCQRPWPACCTFPVYAPPGCRPLEQREPSSAPPSCDRLRFKAAARHDAGHHIPVNNSCRQPSAASLCGSIFHPEPQTLPTRRAGRHESMLPCADGIGLMAFQNTSIFHEPTSKQTHFCAASRIRTHERVFPSSLV